MQIGDQIRFEEYKKVIYEVIRHAVQTVPYYKGNTSYKLPEYVSFTYEWFQNNIPILEKEIVRNNSEQFLDQTIPTNMLSMDSTSGTEGKPIICYRSKLERIRCAKSIWDRRREYLPDLSPKDRFARFYAFRNTEDEIITGNILYKDNDILVPLFDLSENSLIKYWNAICEFSPKWMHGPSSTIYNLACVIEKYELSKSSIEFIELSGEYVSKEKEILIKRVFECPIANHYGCREYWPLAYTVANKGLKVCQDNVFFEKIFNQEIAQTEFLITLLKNNAWPLIRYRIQDFGDYYYEGNSIYLSIHRGRKAAFFKLEDGTILNAVMFSGIIRAICEWYGTEVIRQFQVINNKNEYLEIKLKLDGNCNMDEIKNRVYEEVVKITKTSILVKVIETSYIEPNSKTEKTEEFINLL